MEILVLSTSLNPGSRSAILARYAFDQLQERGESIAWVDLRELPLPLCDGGAAYGDANVATLAEKIKTADLVLVGTPIYNYDVNAAFKNAVELTGPDAWEGKVAGFLCAAGGQGSYMSLLGIANSLMLDFRTTIVPRFIYATGKDFRGDEIANSEVEERINRLLEESTAMARALHEVGSKGA